MFTDLSPSLVDVTPSELIDVNHGVSQYTEWKDWHVLSKSYFRQGVDSED